MHSDNLKASDHEYVGSRPMTCKLQVERSLLSGFITKHALILSLLSGGPYFGEGAVILGTLFKLL